MIMLSLSERGAELHIGRFPQCQQKNKEPMNFS